MHPIVGMAPAPVRPRPAGLLVALVRKPAAPIVLAKAAGTSSPVAPRLLTPEEVASCLGISRSKVYVLLNMPEPDGIPSLKIGGCRRIRVDRLDEWIAEQEARS